MNWNNTTFKKAVLIFLGMLLLIALLRIVHSMNSQTLTEYAAQHQDTSENKSFPE